MPRSAQANPVKNQKSASLLSQVLTLLKAKLAVKDDVLSFVANPAPVINCANGEVWIGPTAPSSYGRTGLNRTYGIVSMSSMPGSRVPGIR